MKETKIAKENVEKLGELLSPDKYVIKGKCQEHKQTCQRWLKFLEAITKWRSWERMSEFAQANINNQIEDLKQAIKTYEDVGI